MSAEHPVIRAIAEGKLDRAVLEEVVLIAIAAGALSANDLRRVLEEFPNLNLLKD